MSNLTVNTPAPINNSVPGIQTMHGDTASSDTSALSGPGTNRDALDVKFEECMATFPTMLRCSHGNVMALATYFGKPLRHYIAEQHGSDVPMVQPQVWLIDGDTGEQLAKPVDVPQVSIFGGVYAYLDQFDDGLVVTSASFPDGSKELKTVIKKYIGKEVTPDNWRIDDCGELANISHHLYHRNVNENSAADLGAFDSVVSLSPDQDGAIWFASAQGKVGISHIRDRDEPVTYSTEIEKGETINNSFSTIHHPALGNVAAITSNKKTYLFKKCLETGRPVLVWSNTYLAGSALKHGQLAYPWSFFVDAADDANYGTGATPSFFGENGFEWVTITDNADDALNMLVYNVETGELVGSHPVFGANLPDVAYARGTENSAIAYGTSVIVPSTCGYPYPVGGFKDREDHPFVGGIERFDLLPDGNGGWDVKRIWSRPHRSSAVPKYSFVDGVIYTLTRHSSKNHQSDATPYVPAMSDVFAYAAIDFETGDLLCEKLLNMDVMGDTPPPVVAGPVVQDIVDDLNSMGNPLQMACCFTVDSHSRPVMWQGTMSGYYRISSKSS